MCVQGLYLSLPPWTRPLNSSAGFQRLNEADTTMQQHVEASPAQRQAPLPHAGGVRRARQAWEDGRRLRAKGQLQAARQKFEQAAQWAPGDALYWLNLARCEQQLGHTGHALDHAQRAFDLDRRSTLACNLAAEILRDERRYREMLSTLDRLASDGVRDARWHLLKSAAQLELRDYPAAVQASAAALANAGPDLSMRRQSLMHLGHCLSLMKRHDEASWCYRMILDVDPLALGSALYAAHFSAWACDWTMLEQDLQRLQDCIDRVQAADDDLDKVEALSPFCLLTLTDSPQVLKWTAQIAARKARTDVKPRPAHWPVPRPGGKLRIGLMSADFHMHATSILIAEMLEGIDRDHFELVFYSGGPDDHSPMRARVQATASRWHEVLGWTNEQLAARIREDEIGVLVEMKGYTLGSRLTVMGQRAAPVQVAWLGYPGTTGVDYIDYLIGDPIVTPLAAQDDYTECIAQMPHCYQPNDSTRSQPPRMSRADCGLPEDAFVFASFNQSYKIVPEVFTAWCHILAATPGSVLWLLVPQPDVQIRLRQAATSQGIDPQRLIFTGFVGTETHRARLQQADLFLDSFPCSGHTTASDALWAGVPVLTLIGQNFAARVAASLLHTAGLPELVCHSLDDYAQAAITYAQDRPALAAVQQRLVQAHTDSPLFQGRQFARDFQQLLLRMVERQDAGLPPAPLAALTASLPDLPHPTPEAP